MSTSLTEKNPTGLLKNIGDAVNGDAHHIRHEAGGKVESAHVEYTDKEIGQAFRKIDLIIVPVMTVVLAFSFIDRTNMGLAAVAGMNENLGLTGSQYSICLLAYFPGYIIFVLPSNYILSKWSVRWWLSILTITFGLFTLAMGLVQNFASLVVMRFFLGICEAGVYPTVASAASAWYPRYQVGKRISAIVTGASLISALSGIIAYALSRIEVGSYVGWRWIFLIEGAVTVLVGCIVFFILDEYPENSRFLNPRQKELTVALIHKDRPEFEEEDLTVSLVFKNLKDWTIWVFAILYMFSVSTTYGMAYFMPLILNGQMGFTGAVSQLLSTPPYFYSLILAGCLSWISDKRRIRSPFIIFFALNVTMGIPLVRWDPNTGSQYLGMFFVIGGALAQAPMVIIWDQNNAATRTKRSVSAGLLFTFGAIGGIIGSTVFRTQDAPTYTPGIISVLCLTGVVLVLTLILALHFYRQNRVNKETGTLIEEQEGFLRTL